MSKIQGIQLEVRQSSGKVTKEQANDIKPESRIGQFFFPSGIQGEFGQIVEVRLKYADGHIRTYSTYLIAELNDE